MEIQFVTDTIHQGIGFTANIYYTPLPNKECESWLDMNGNIFKSPNYPLQYNSKKCSWVIFVDVEFHVSLKFSELYVRFKIINIEVISPIIQILNLINYRTCTIKRPIIFYYKQPKKAFTFFIVC